MSGTDNFQAFLASHRQEKARVRALRSGTSATGSLPATSSPAATGAAAAAASVASLGAEPHWQLKVHSNDPRDRAVAAAQQAATSPALAAPPPAGGFASPEKAGEGAGAFQIGGMSFMPSDTYTPPLVEKGSIVNSFISSLKTPRSPDRVAVDGGAASSPGDASMTLLKSMTSALARIKSKDKGEGGSMSAMEELQELAQLANMAASQPPGGGGAGATQQATALLQKGLEEQMARHQQQLNQLYADGSRTNDHDSPIARLRQQEMVRLTGELNTMREQLQRIRAAQQAQSQATYSPPAPSYGNSTYMSSPPPAPANETDRLKQQLDGMRHHLESMHAEQARAHQQQQQQQQQQQTPPRDDTNELMTELERMRARLRHVEDSKLRPSAQQPPQQQQHQGGGMTPPGDQGYLQDQYGQGYPPPDEQYDQGGYDQGGYDHGGYPPPSLSKDVEIQPDPASAMLPITPGMDHTSDPYAASHMYSNDGYGGGGHGGEMNRLPHQQLNYSGNLGYGGGGAGDFGEDGQGESRPQAIIAAEARLQLAYTRLEFIAKGCLVLGGILFFPGIFSPYGFPCWGAALPLAGFAVLYVYSREPEMSLPVPATGHRGSKIWLACCLVISILLIVAGGFAARGAEVVRNLFNTPVCGAMQDCNIIPPNLTIINASGVFTNLTGVAVPADCMPSDTYAGAYLACEALSMCAWGGLSVGDCNGINGINIFTSVLCILASIFLLMIALWAYTVLDVRVQEHHQLLERDIKELEDEFEYADLSAAACMNILCEDWGLRVGNMQHGGFEPSNTNPLPQDNLERNMHRPNETQHGDHGLTAEALEARILTPGRQLPSAYSPQAARGEPVNAYSVRSPQPPGGQQYY